MYIERSELSTLPTRGRNVSTLTGGDRPGLSKKGGGLGVGQ